MTTPGSILVTFKPESCGRGLVYVTEEVRMAGSHDPSVDRYRYGPMWEGAVAHFIEERRGYWLTVAAAEFKNL